MREIAAELSVSTHTVRTHVHHLYQRLGAQDRTEVVECARVLGLLAPPVRRALLRPGKPAGLPGQRGEMENMGDGWFNDTFARIVSS